MNILFINLYFMGKNFLWKIAPMVIFSILFFGTSFVQAAPSKLVPLVSQIVTSNTYVRADGKEKFSLRVVVKNISVIKKTEIIVDGKIVKTCKTGVQVCEVNVGPFAEDKMGEHVYIFKTTGKNGTSNTQWGLFWVVTPDEESAMSVVPAKTNIKLFAHNKNGVGVLELVNTKNQYTVGDKGNRLLLMRGHAGLASIEENGSVMNIDSYSAGTLMGPFTDADIGEHIIEYTMNGKSGKSTKTRIQYWVLPKGGTLPPPVSDFQ